MGMSFGAYFTDTGCVDRHYVQHNLEARQMGVPYSGERILADCWAEQLVTSTLRFWAYRYDQTGDEIDFWLRLVLWLLLLYDMVHVTLHTVYIREPSLFGGPQQQQVLALTGPKWPTVIHRIVRYSMVLRRKYQLPKTKLRRLISRRFLLLECPTWLLPVLCDVLESRLTAPQWMILLAGSQLVVLLRAFLESEAFAIAEKLVFAISSSIGQIAGLCLVIGISTIAMTSVHGQLFGIFHFETAGGLGTWPNLWLEIFNVLIAGAAVDPELFAFNPWGVAMMCLHRHPRRLLRLCRHARIPQVSRPERATTLRRLQPAAQLGPRPFPLPRLPADELRHCVRRQPPAAPRGRVRIDPKGGGG